MLEHIEIISLLFDLLTCQLLRIIDQKTDDPGIVNVALPQLLGELVITSDLLRDLVRDDIAAGDQRGEEEFGWRHSLVATTAFRGLVRYVNQVTCPEEGATVTFRRA